MTDATAPGSPGDAADIAPATSPVGIPRIGLTPVVPRTAPPAAPAAPSATTLLVDSAPRRLRRAEDLLDLALCVIGVAAMLLLATYGHETTTGVTSDVQNALAVVMRRIVVFPLQAIEGLVTFIVPVVVILSLLLRRSWRSAGEALLAGVGGNLLALVVLRILITWAPETLLAGLVVVISGYWQVGVSTVFAALAGLLTGAGERHSSPYVRHGWTALWIIVGLTVLRGALTLPGAVLSLLLGRLVGLLVRYAFGVDDRSARGLALVRALRRAGIDAVRVVRMDRSPFARAWTVTTQSPLGYTEQVRETPLAAPIDLSMGPAGSPADPAGPADPTGPAAGFTESGDAGRAEPPSAEPSAPVLTIAEEPVGSVTPAHDVNLAEVLAEASSAALSEGRSSVHRLYAVWDSEGVRRDVTVLDADRQVAGFLANIWNQIRVRGLFPTRDRSVRAAAEHAALMTLEARRACVRTPSLFGMAEADESVLLVTDHVVGARSLSDLGDEMDDDVLDQLWEQLRRAHSAGLAHRDISASSVVVDDSGKVWLLDWDSGETISSELSRRIDLAQALALSAATTGVERAIAAASRALTTQQVASIAPMLQSVVLPADTREAMGRRGRVLQELRDALVDLTPTAHAEPAKLTRFSARTVVMAVVSLVALWTLLARMNFTQISEAIAGANAWWILGALFFSLATYLGAGLALVALSPVRLSVWKSTEVHLASSVVALVAPAGVGGAAINLRFLNRQGVPTPVGVATVALVQVVQFAVTVVLLIVLAATTGQSTGLTLPSGWLVLAAVVVVAVVGAALLVPRVRAFLWAKMEPTYRQVWPRLVWILSNPVRLGIGIGGTVLLSLSYVMAFGASLWAFGYTLPFSVLAITYLASNTVGSVVPSPGGIGPVEIALTAGLVAAGIPSGVALSAAIVYRLVTFWIPIPVGWLSLQRLQRAGDM